MTSDNKIQTVTSSVLHYEITTHFTFSGKRNQLYPDEYKYPPKPVDTESFVSKPPVVDFSNEETEDNKPEILWDRREPVDNDPHEKLDFVLNEFLMELGAEYGVFDEEPDAIEEGNEEQEQVFDNEEN
uniref:Uncharacterized protein n=1 Tax=Cacopsylla melanoneura TaxID=428564 RepID=A0A8D8TT33_9HEMI